MNALPSRAGWAGVPGLLAALMSIERGHHDAHCRARLVFLLSRVAP